MTMLDGIAHTVEELRDWLQVLGFAEVKAAWLAVGFNDLQNARIVFENRQGSPRAVGFHTQEIYIERVEEIIRELTGMRALRRRRLGPRKITEYGSAP